MGRTTTRSASKPFQVQIAASSEISKPSSGRLTFRSRKITRVAADDSSSKPSTTVDSAAASATAVTVPLLTTYLKPLSLEGELSLALDHLRRSDSLLADLIDCHRPPVLDSQRSPFLSLARSILHQQLAPTASRSIYDRFVKLCGGESTVLPAIVLKFPSDRLRKIGISGRKASYLHDLAEKYRDGKLSDEKILEMSDEELLAQLTRVKGIGAWSVHMFMIFSLHRPDVLPIGDLGVRKGLQSLYGFKDLPLPLQMEQICEKWRPYRSVGSWYMWRLMEAKSAAKSLKTAGRINYEE